MNTYAEFIKLTTVTEVDRDHVYFSEEVQSVERSIFVNPNHITLMYLDKDMTCIELVGSSQQEAYEIKVKETPQQIFNMSPVRCSTINH